MARLPFSLRGRRTFTAPHPVHLENGDRLLWARPVPGGAVLVLESQAPAVWRQPFLCVCITHRGRLQEVAGLFVRRRRASAIARAAALVAQLQEQRAPRRPTAEADDAWLRQQLAGVRGKEA